MVVMLIHVRLTIMSYIHRIGLFSLGKNIPHTLVILNKDYISVFLIYSIC